MQSGLGWLDIILVILATYRLAQLVSKDKGPFGVFERARMHARKRAGYYQGMMTNGSLPEWERYIASRMFILWRNVVDWLDCPYCNGVWFAAMMLAPIVTPARPVGWWIVAWLAVAGGQAFLQEVANDQ